MIMFKSIWTAMLLETLSHFPKVSKRQFCWLVIKSNCEQIWQIYSLLPTIVCFILVANILKRKFPGRKYETILEQNYPNLHHNSMKSKNGYCAAFQKPEWKMKVTWNYDAGIKHHCSTVKIFCSSKRLLTWTKFTEYVW